MVWRKKHLHAKEHFVLSNTCDFELLLPDDLLALGLVSMRNHFPKCA